PYSPTHDPRHTSPYTLSLHDALPISERIEVPREDDAVARRPHQRRLHDRAREARRIDEHERRRRSRAHPRDHLRVERRQRRRLEESEEHTSELQSLRHLVCRLLLEKK